MRTVIYARVSTDRQTLEQQKRTVFGWLDAHGMTHTDIVTDEGISGGVSYKDRNLGKLLDTMNEGDTLIVSEISRLGRSMSDLNKLINDELKPRKVRLIVVQMGLDLNCANIKALDEMILFAFGFAAQLEKELIQSRVQSAIDARKDKLARDGYFISKSGRKCTSLGNGKGVDMKAANTASAKSRRQRAAADRDNLVRWNILSMYKDDYTRASELLNTMNIRTASGMEFTKDRARTTYHNLKKIYTA